MLFKCVQALSLLKYRRELLTETDTLPLRLLHQSGVDLTDMLTMFKVLQKHASSQLESISTHTNMSYTLEKLEILIE